MLLPAANFWKQTHLEKYIPVPLMRSLFYQMHNIIADLCLILLNLKMSITISNWGLIWKYNRYARKSQNDATTNQIILKTLTWGEWPSEQSHCKGIGRFLAETLLSALSGLGTQPYYKTPSDLWVKASIKATMNTGWVTLSP